MFSREIRQELSVKPYVNHVFWEILTVSFCSFSFQIIYKRDWRKLIEEKTKIMKNYSNHSSEVNGRRSYLDDLFWNHPFAFFTFESLVVIISLVIISTSSLVIRQITKAHKKRKQNINRSDFAIISLSVSDITVGLFSVPLYGISFSDITKSKSIMWYASWFFIEPPLCIRP